MLFNTYNFIFYFLFPILFIYNFVPNQFKILYLILVSIVFYVQWDFMHFMILAVSIVINYMFANVLSTLRPYKIVILWVAISLNLFLLGYFKYSNFLEFSDKNIVLPLAISFFTFQQIAYLYDVYRKKIVLESFDRYIFFVMFFPQLVAGPIVHYNEIMKQVDKGELFRANMDSIYAGIVLFSLGLFSKVVLADNLLQENYHSWNDVFSYSFMIYFDFSGYANMAIGLALMFGIILPTNFNSPYKARNLLDFWRKWHITLGNFLKEHIYIPLGGNRYGINKQVSALMVTMILGGIWHGAGWNFLLWGAAHGFGLVFLSVFKKIKLYKFVSISITFLYVSLLWVLFFSPSFNDAVATYKFLFSYESFNIDTIDAIWLFICGFIVWVMPNSMEIIDTKKKDFGLKNWHAYMSGFLFFVSLKFMADAPSVSFVYFNF